MKNVCCDKVEQKSSPGDELMNCLRWIETRKAPALGVTV